MTALNRKLNKERPPLGDRFFVFKGDNAGCVQHPALLGKEKIKMKKEVVNLKDKHKIVYLYNIAQMLNYCCKNMNNL